MGNYAGFQKVKLTRPQRSTFDLSHEIRTSAFLGDLFPVLMMECVPSDKFNGSSECLLRMAPLLAPIYDQIRLYVHFFFVPNRLLWDEWEDFITGGNFVNGSPEPATAPVPPFREIEKILTESSDFFAKYSLADYLGCPILPLSGETAPDYADINLHLMPFGAYELVWQNYYRDRNFVGDTSADIPQFPMVSGENPWTGFLDAIYLHTRSYEHDYFTSALPFTQRGADVLIPVDGTVTYLTQSRVVRSDTGTLLTNNDLIGTTQDAPDFPPGSLAFQNAPNDDGVASRIENIDSIANATTTINDFRAAYALQVWLERNAIAGSRYTESTQAHFGVRPQDSRLQRPEYIGGGMIPIKISEVVAPNYSTNADDDVVAAGNLGGHGVTYGNTNKFSYFCTEHGFIIGICSIMPRASYHQGMPRMFYKRNSFLDYPWPTFAKLGEQAVDKAEIYADKDTLLPDADGEYELFGYQSRYADWKYMCSGNRADFHDTLLFWTLTRDFGAPGPSLDSSFSLVNASVSDRIFAVDQSATNTAGFWLYFNHRIQVKRPLPYFGTPNTLGFS